jgi:two-component system sensor histidine kinase BaeS
MNALPAAPPGPRDPKRIGPRLSLFDAGKNPVVGGARTAEDHTLQAIRVDGETVGWLGLRKRERLSHPLDQGFLRQQRKAFYVVGGLMLLLAAVAAFLFSRHMLAPIRRLIEGTRALTRLKFDTRIAVETRDELGRLASDFNELAGTLQQYETRQRQWLSDISHELRTPLSVLQGEIEALQDGVRAPAPETLASLHAEVLRLSRIVEELHDLSTSESGNFRLNRTPLRPVDVLQRTLDLFRRRFEEQHITVEEEPGGDAEVELRADEDRLVQLFSNLLENSLRFTDAPGILKVRHDVGYGAWILHLEDSAPAVPKDSLGRLFDRLFRVDASRSRSRGGSGLGLSICKHIVEAHGGLIQASPGALGGLHVEIRIPLDEDRRKGISSHDDLHNPDRGG